jgi:hypothetical protein
VKRSPRLFPDALNGESVFALIGSGSPVWAYSSAPMTKQPTVAAAIWRLMTFSFCSIDDNLTLRQPRLSGIYPKFSERRWDKIVSCHTMAPDTLTYRWWQFLCAASVANILSTHWDGVPTRKELFAS